MSRARDSQIRGITGPAAQTPSRYRSVSPGFLKWLSETDTEKLECRIFGHHWPGFMEDNARVAKRAGQYFIEAFCNRGCGVKRNQVVGSDGVLDSAVTRYDYSEAKGYQYSEDDWTMSAAMRGLIRLELITRKQEREKSGV
jgi:hypothetical protein